MQSINFDTGVKKYAVNGDENNVISINVNDVNIVKRMEECQNSFEKIQKELESIKSPTPDQIVQYDKQIRDMIDYAFSADVCSHAFGNMNCLSPLENGELVCTAFLNAFVPLVLSDIKKVAKSSNKEISDKTKKYTSFEEPAGKDSLFDINKLTDKQIAYLKSLES